MKTIKLNGKEYEYDLNLNAMVNFENETGKSLINADLTNEMSIKDIRALLWAGINETQEITIEEVGKMVNLDNIEKASTEIMAAFEDVLPEGDNEAQVKNKNRSVG